jgi:hypothetical protein
MLSIGLEGMVAQRQTDDQKECAGHFEPELMERPENTAKNLFEFARHVSPQIILPEDRICELTKFERYEYDGRALKLIRREPLQLDDNLKQLIQELGAAINDALSESNGINEAIQNVKNAGYDVFLVLEATIGFNKKTAETTETAVVTQTDDAQLKVTGQDLKFLRSLKISVEDLDAQ